MKEFDFYTNYLDEQLEIALGPILIGAFVGSIIGQQIVNTQDKKMGACFDKVNQLAREKKIVGFNNKRIAILNCRIEFCNNILKSLKANRSKCNKSADRDLCLARLDKEIMKFQKLIYRYQNAKQKIQTQKIALPRLI